jgi:hypothetical protein
VILLLAIVWGVVWGPQTFSFYWYEYLNRKHLAEFEAAEEMYRTDTNGGETPEETLDLFVSALEAGDAGLAASYFVPEKRGEMERAVNNWKKNEGIDLVISSLQEAEEGNFLGNSKYQIPIVGDDGVVSITIDLIKNQHSQKWLIESL